MLSAEDYDNCAGLDSRYDSLKRLGIVTVIDSTPKGDPSYSPRYRIKLDVAAFCKWVESSNLFAHEEINNLLFWAARDGAKELGL